MKNFKLVVSISIIVFLSELIGTKIFTFSFGKLVLLPMLYAVIIGILVTPSVLGKKFTFLQKFVSNKEVEKAGSFVMISLLFLGVKYGALVGPNIVEVISAGPALLLQELGNLATPVIAVPLALLLGLNRESVGACVSICREPTLGIIGEKYGMDSPEGNGVLGTYMVGTVIGTIFFGFLGSLAINTGLHPYALAMASGVGSGSMMASASGSLSSTVSPEFKDVVLAYAATSNMLTGVTGIYSVLFLALPFTNWYYGKLSKFKKGKVS